MKIRIILIMAMMLLVMLAACTNPAGAFSNFSSMLKIGTPQVNSLSYSLNRIDMSGIGMNTVLKVHNPNLFDANLNGGDLEFYLNDIKIGTAKLNQASSLPAQSDGQISMGMILDVNRMSEWLKTHIQRGESSIVKVKGVLSVGVALLTIQYPVNEQRNFKTNLLDNLSLATIKKLALLPGLSVQSIKSTWGQVNGDQVQLSHVIQFRNDTGIQITSPQLRFEIEANGIAILNGQTNKPVEVHSGDNTVSLATFVSTSKTVEWFVSHLKNGEKTSLLLKIKPVNNQLVESPDIRQSVDGFAFGADLKTSLPKEISLPPY